MTDSDWQARCAARKQTQLDSIPKEWLINVPSNQMNVMNVPKECGLLSDRELDITETVDVEVLLSKLATGEWSSLEVTTAFYKRAIIAQQLTSCLTEIFVERALQRAKELDEILKITGKVVGPLHGLPISLKDQFTMKGLETIMGYVAWIGQYAEADCVLVEILYDCGAVPFVRTNVPQTLMYLTAGGSSGGEGALLAMKGSPLGVGTDIGGAFCGLYTLRPSYERLPYCGGSRSISSVLGPMTNSISGVKVFTKAVLDAKPWLKDPVCIRKEWSDKEYELAYHGGGKKLCFGIMWDNGVVRPHPPLNRAMMITKRALEAAGHIVLDWESHRHLEIYKNSETIFVADGGEDYRIQCERSGEPLILSMLPGEGAHETTLEEPYVKRLLWELHKEKRDLRKSHLDHWEATVSRTGTGRPIDAIISPAVAYAAVPHGLNTDSFYTTLCNAMDYATSVFPVTFVDGTLDHKHPPHEFYNHEDEAIYNLYDSGLFDGCPVGLQLIGRTQEEEAVIAMTEIVDRALRQYEGSKA
ncbi:general amidase [Gymnopus androsaceus JB14]|uniref:General amidase n=1 Tax=Gymnopus androsaceus JB14 TaxID=1447944 RepID=A0A6A4HGD6_9AGAR|nr:general amidase [Gymnopus androsaceus JB14]